MVFLFKLYKLSDFPFLNFKLSGADKTAKFGTKRRKKFQRPKIDLNSARLGVAFIFQISSVA